MIDGLKLTITGEELRSLLERRIDDHLRTADGWKREQERTPEQATDDEPLLPDHMCANEAERHEWRAEVLEFLRDHIDAKETYRLGEDDLAFGELLPRSRVGSRSRNTKSGRQSAFSRSDSRKPPRACRSCRSHQVRSRSMTCESHRSRSEQCRVLLCTQRYVN
jgi:hypothetical protein